MGNSYSELASLDDNDIMLVQTERDRQLSNQIGFFSPHKQPTARPVVHLDNINWLSPVRPEMVISCSSDRTIALNNMDTGACLTRWRGHEREVTKVVYKVVGCTHFLLSGSKDTTVRLWHFNSAESRKVFTGHHQLGITGLMPLDEARFVSGARDGRVALWDVQRGIPIRSVGSSQNLVTHIDRDPEDRVLCQTAEDGALRLWDAHNLSLICRLPSNSSHAQWHCSVVPSEPNTCVTAGGGTIDDGCAVGLWDLRQRKCMQQFRGHESDVRCAILLHQQQVTWKRLILSVSADKSARLWDVNTGRCVWTEHIPAELNSCVGFSDGSVVVAGGNATLCDLRLLVKAGRPYLFLNSIQSNNNDR